MADSKPHLYRFGASAPGAPSVRAGVRRAGLLEAAGRLHLRGHGREGQAGAGSASPSPLPRAPPGSVLPRLPRGSGDPPPRPKAPTLMRISRSSPLLLALGRPAGDVVIRGPPRLSRGLAPGKPVARGSLGLPLRAGLDRVLAAVLLGRRPRLRHLPPGLPAQRGTLPRPDRDHLGTVRLGERDGLGERHAGQLHGPRAGDGPGSSGRPVVESERHDAREHADVGDRRPLPSTSSQKDLVVTIGEASWQLTHLTPATSSLSDLLTTGSAYFALAVESLLSVLVVMALLFVAKALVSRIRGVPRWPLWWPLLVHRRSDRSAFIGWYVPVNQLLGVISPLLYPLAIGLAFFPYLPRLWDPSVRSVAIGFEPTGRRVGTVPVLRDAHRR